MRIYMMTKHPVFLKTLGSFWLVLSIVLFLSAFNTLRAQNESPTPETDDFLVGSFDREALQKGDFGEHFLSEYQAYQPNQDLIKQLRQAIYDCTIVVVLGTWCQDSQQQVPRFYKVLDELHYNTSTVTNICVDKNKEAEGTSVNDLNIERVPTIIFYKKGKEIGRIIETPDTSLEEDSFQIVKTK